MEQYLSFIYYVERIINLYYTTQLSTHENDWRYYLKKKTVTLFLGNNTFVIFELGFSH